MLGHKISKRGSEVDKAKLNIISNLEPPQTVREVRSFLGPVAFYRRFLKDFSKITAPMCTLLCKDKEFNFDEECLKSFNVLKKLLCSAPIIQPPDWTLPFEIMTDANDRAVGDVLGQRLDKKPVVIYYTSKMLDQDHVNYATIEKELLAVMFALKITFLILR